MKALIFGSRSDIAADIHIRMIEEGWTVRGWNRDSKRIPEFKWNVCLIALGKVSPVGFWSDVEEKEFDDCVESNILLPMRLLRRVWYLREKPTSVCFMAGSNPQKPMAGYSAYNLGKMALLKVCEQLDFETPDAKFFALAPGYIPTKIHKPTLDKGWVNERIAKGGGTPMEKVYETFKWCLRQPKEVVGGRNICVTDIRDDLDKRLKDNPSMFKLRRVE